MHQPFVRAVAALSAVAAVAAVATPGPTRTDHDDPARHPYLGLWVTRDGHIRHELLPNGRYDEQRGERRSAYQGRYWIKGDRIVYLDDTGFSADGEFRDGVFFHGGYVFHRAAGR
jgi:Agrobacterium tumefaciens protein Atu4866